MNPIVKKFLQKQLFNQKGTIASAKSVQFSYDALETRMKNIGLDINLIKTEKDLNQALGFVKSIEDQVFQKQFGDVLKKKETAKVFDLEGRQLDTKKPIMGGTQREEDILKKSIKKNVDEATKKGDFKGIFNQVLRDPDIAREFMLSKKFPFRRDTNVLSGEDAIPLARKAKFDEEMGIKKMAKEREIDYNVDKLVSDFKKFGNATDKDIQMILSSGKSGQIPYVMDNYGMSYTDVINTLKRGDDLIEGLATGGRAGFKEGNGKDDGIIGITMSIEERMERIRKLLKQMQDIKKGVGIDPDPEEKADGGRAGFKVGSPSKRLFLKTAGGLAALITAIKSGLIGMPKKEVAKQVVKESAKDVANAPPQYFFDLAQTIKKFGKPDKVTYSDRVEIHRMVSKDGKSELQLTEDLSTGNIQIKKIKPEDDMVNEDIVLEYRKGDVDVDPEAGTAFKEADQYTEGREVTQRIYKDNYNEPDFYEGEGIDEIKKEIIKDTTEKKIKRAGGGVAYMLGE